MSSKLKFFLLAILFIFISLQYGWLARKHVANFSTTVTKKYLTITQGFDEFIKEHLKQKRTIRKLKERNSVLEQSAILSVAFASKLNDLLEANGKAPYDPKLELVQAISYANLGNHYRVWLDFEDFDHEKIYGLVYGGYSAGIAISEGGKPLALLQGDPKSIFSVNIGEGDIPGVAMGNGETIHVKYIPLWMEPKIGDEVVTSGKDTIFFPGVPVGKVVEIVLEESYQSVIVRPYASVKAPIYLYAIK